MNRQHWIYTVMACLVSFSSSALITVAVQQSSAAPLPAPATEPRSVAIPQIDVLVEEPEEDEDDHTIELPGGITIPLPHFGHR
ncbi:hypothetical protein D5S17_11045 [Pseudonocardiaceae bacterium YIM PH 21723]|nr:hypothetical protein D5S17_11045 [Pseudonocardiaceae bacterium YIM PH 21723]